MANANCAWRERTREPRENDSGLGWQGSRCRWSEPDGAFRAVLRFNLLLLMSSPEVMKHETEDERGKDA